MEIPLYSQLRHAYHNLSPLELVVFSVLVVLVTLGGMGLLNQLQDNASTVIPTRGGHYHEGIVGFPQYINPVLARSDADRDLSALVHAGLTKLTTSGDITLDLAEAMEVSENGETYTFTIRDDAVFHDGQPVTAEDIAFTISLIQDPVVNSPQQSDWNSISVEVIDDKTVAFNLSQPFTSFPYTARIGILPAHLWENETISSISFSSLNVRPVGAGPYQVADIIRNEEGIPNRYDLTAAETYHSTPYIKRVSLSFFTDANAVTDAFRSEDIDGFYGADPHAVDELNTNNTQIVSKSLNRVFAIYYNQNNNEVLVEADLRRALDSVIPRREIIQEALYGYGKPLDGPLPSIRPAEEVSSSTIRAARETLTTAGWEESGDTRVNEDGETLSIELTTAAIPALQETANRIAESWEDIGVSVTVTTLPVNELTQSIIRPRDYEALLFGQVINQSGDLYPFWHSSGQDDPGLNLAIYTNSSIDDALSQWRVATSTVVRDNLQSEITETITDDQPASFVYSPSFIYILPDNIRNAAIPPITTPSDRFARITDWHTSTTKLWNIFLDDDQTNAEKASR
ncbi:MAG: peptide ABC transporter substrate-binding protein [Candidatus Paceibacterota bacterium]